MSLNDFSAVPVAEFPAARGAAYDPQTPSRSVISADGHSVYLTDGCQVWAYQVGGKTVTPYNLSAPINGLGVSDKALNFQPPEASSR